MSYEIREMQKIRMAEDAVSPVVGPVVGMDSSSAVYREALKRLGVDCAGVTDSFSLGRMFDMARSTGRKAHLAMDAASVEDRAKRFPNGSRLA